MARHGRRGFAERFVAGSTLADALQTVTRLSKAGRAVILNHLGENVTTKDEARKACASYVQMLRSMREANIRGNIAIKLTQLGLDIDPELCLSSANEIAATASGLQNTIEIDMEGSAYTEATITTYEDVQRRHGNAGIAIQAYLRRSQSDVRRLAPLNPKIRLVKGAYREPASVAFQQKSEVDANYRKLLDEMFSTIRARGFAQNPRNRQGMSMACPVVAIATHDPALVDYASAQIAESGLPVQTYEFQMLLGIRRDLQEKVIAAGHPFRVYVPFGEAWIPYFMRRLSERPANIWFVLRSLFAESRSKSAP